MKKPVKIALVVLVLLLVPIVVAVLLVDRLVEGAVEEGGAYALGVPVPLESADVGLLSGELALEGLAVRNPPGFDAENLLEVQGARMRLTVGSLLEDTIVVPRLEVEGVTVGLVWSPGGSNVGPILASLERLQSGDEAPAEAGGKRFRIEEVVIRDVRASVEASLGGAGAPAAARLSIPEIALRDVGTAEDGATVAEVVGTVLQAVLQAVLEAGAGVVPGDVLTDLGARVGRLDELALERVEAAVREASEEVEDAARKVERRVDELGEKAGEVLEGVEGVLGGEGGGEEPKKP